MALRILNIFTKIPKQVSVFSKTVNSTLDLRCTSQDEIRQHIQNDTGKRNKGNVLKRCTTKDRYAKEPKIEFSKSIDRYLQNKHMRNLYDKRNEYSKYSKPLLLVPDHKYLTNVMQLRVRSIHDLRTDSISTPRNKSLLCVFSTNNGNQPQAIKNRCKSNSPTVRLSTTKRLLSVKRRSRRKKKYILRRKSAKCKSKRKPCKIVIKCRGLRRKRLPVLKAAYCPCTDTQQPSRSPRLKRLRAKPVVEPPRKCAIPCHVDKPRADDGMTVKRKELPALKPRECPCPREELPKYGPRMARLNLYVPEPPRPPPIPCEIRTPRSDKGMKVKRKILPVIESACCPCVEEFVPYENPGLKRPVPKPVREPPRKCAIPCEEVTPRSDAGMKIKRRELPVIEEADCPCVDEPPLKEAPKIKRLDLYVPEPPRPPPIPCEIRTPRSDRGMKIERKNLPVIESAANCPCVEEFIPYENPGLKRPIPKPVREPPRKCAIPCELVTPRSDAGMKVERKELPVMDESDCPCVEEPPLKEAPKIKRLDLYVPEPPRPPPIPCEIRTPRSDKGMKVKCKTLPVIESSYCPCVEEFVPYENPGLKRPVPKPVREPPRKCAIPCELVTPRSDAGMKIKRRELPVIEEADCPCVDEPPLKEAPKIKRLDLYVPEPPRPPPIPCEIRTPRSDRGMKIERKNLPVIESAANCPCVEEFIPYENPGLKRPIPKPVREPPRKCAIPCELVTPRSDAGMKIERKELPVMQQGKCPCPQLASLKDAPKLGRLNLYVPEPPKIPPPPCQQLTPRADDGMKMKSKTLPTMEPQHCEVYCLEPPHTAPLLKKLIPKPVREPPRDCLKKCGHDAPRADSGLAIVSRELPTLKVGTCPTAAPCYPRCLRVSRPKFRKIREPKRICPPPFCDLIPRSDRDGWEYVARCDTERRDTRECSDYV